jgi:hypothetical protein
MSGQHALVTPVGGTTLDDVRWDETEARGYLPVTVNDGRREVDIVFYDATRLAQDVEAEVASSGQFASPPIVVLPSVTQSAVEAAARALADAGFAPVTRW